MYIIMKQTVDLALKLERTDIINNLNELHKKGLLEDKKTYYKYETNEEHNAKSN